MLKIRLKRIGRRGDPHYRVVVTESSRPRNGKSVAILGFYNPQTHPSTFQVEEKEVKQWLSNGAQPTDTVEQLLVKAGILKEISRGSKLPQPKAKKKAQPEESAPKAETPAVAEPEVKEEALDQEAPKEEPKAEEAPMAETKAEEKPAEEAKPETTETENKTEEKAE